MKLFSLVLLFISLFQDVTLANSKIINGTAPEAPHPAKFNTVAIVKEDGSVYCTGSIIGPKLIVTAKHCLVDREIKDINIFFGDSTHEPGITIGATGFEVRHPSDWTMMFPSFDIAWIKFEQELPSGYRPLPILADQQGLSIGMDIYQAGFGNHSPISGRIEAGERLIGMTQLGRYIDNPRFYNILLFEGDDGQGSCHGDSGGPAYVNLDNQWYIIGVTNGFDVVLTPDTMTRTSDPDFPYNVDCSKNQSLYSFIGAHGKWIEETSNEVVWKSDSFQDLDRAPKQEVETLHAWCEARDFGSPSWNLLKILIDKRVDQLPQENGNAFYNDCEAITNYLKSLESIYLNFNTTPVANIDFSTASLLPQLKSISLYEYPIDQVSLNTLSNINLKELKLINIGLKKIDFGNDVSIESLVLDKNPLLSLQGLEKINGLKNLSLSGTRLKNLVELKDIELESLSLVGMNTSILLGLEVVNHKLRSLDLRDTYIPNPEAIKLFADLKELKLTGTSGKVDLSDNKKLEVLYLNEFKNNDVLFPDSLPKLKELMFTNSDVDNIDFLKGSPLLEDLSLTYNRIQNLSIFEENPFPKLSIVNLSVNPILDVSPLSSLSTLSVLRLFRTPLSSDLIPRTEANCPTLEGPQALKRFCSK